MKSECRIYAVRGPETTQVELSGSVGHLSCVLTAIMKTLLVNGVVEPGDLFLMASAAVLAASDD